MKLPKVEARVESMDGNAAAATSAHAMSEVIAIYPITPSSPMAEAADEFSAKNRENIFGQVPSVYEMQSEGGAVAAIHGAMSAGTLTTTFTASQGLLLMIPSMYKIAGEMTPTLFNVTARTISSHALSIFGDHSDVMACRQTGFSMIASSDQQEIMDQAAIGMAAAINSSMPFLHFFDGFRSSHEISKVETLSYDTMRALIDMEALARFRSRALNPDRPTLKGTAMNPDIWFQGAEARNPVHDAIPGHLLKVYEAFEKLTGRSYRPYEYYGHPEAETVLVIMGSGSNVAQETVEFLNDARQTKLGLLKVRMYRPFEASMFIDVLPKTVKQVAVLDRTKEPGSVGEPLYLDTVGAFSESLRAGKIDHMPAILGGRYGLSSKDFTPTQIKSVFDHMDSNDPANWIQGFTVGIEDDLSGRSLPVQEEIDTEKSSVSRLKFWGLGSDGTVGANKNSIKVIGDNSDKYVQAHFVYDSKKAGGTTVSHLRFSDDPILSNYEINNPNFIAIHNREFLGKYDLLEGLVEGGTVLINTDIPNEEVFASFPEQDQRTMIEKKAKLYAIDAHKVVRELGLPGRINTTMQAAFFKIADILPKDVYVPAVEERIAKTFAKKGQKVVDINLAAFRRGLDSFVEIPVPATPVISSAAIPEIHVAEGDEAISGTINNIIIPIMQLQGDRIPVSKVPADGVFPTGTTKYEKRSIATYVPKWDQDLCIQCGYCAFACPHAAIRLKVSKADEIQMDGYETIQLKGKGAAEDDRWRVQVYPDDCTGCGVCAEVCLGKNKETGVKSLTMVPKGEVLAEHRATLQEFERLPESPAQFANKALVKGVQLVDPLFEFSGACGGCGETPYVKLATQLVGDRMIQANATGCSSIYGGTAPTVPYTRNPLGRGPAWASSLFEDNAEFGLGIRLGVEYLQETAWNLRGQLLEDSGTTAELREALEAIAPLEEQEKSDDVYKTSKAAADRVTKLLAGATDGAGEELSKLATYLTDVKVMIVGGDGWAYDIGYGGLDHVIASGKNVNILVLDTEVYSNTGGQRSKSTFIGGVAKFAAKGKENHKKDLGMMAMNYRDVYVTSIAFGASMQQTLKGMREAVEYPGTSLIIAMSTCIEHGVPMAKGPELSKLAVDTGYWLLYRYDPRRLAEGKNPLQLDSKEPKKDVAEFLNRERRFKRLLDERPERGETLFKEAQRFVSNRYGYYKKLSEMSFEDWILR